MKIVVLADTHIPRRAKTLPDRAWEFVHGADAIIHAGDVLTNEFLDELRKIAPLYAVLGNNDVTLKQVPETIDITLGGVRIAVIYDSGDKKGRAERLRKRFPEADVVVFGHSHVPVNERHGELLLFNPGSPTDRRRQPVCTIGLLMVSNGEIEAEIFPVTEPVARAPES